MKWSEEVPIEEGTYWLFGWTHSYTLKRLGYSPELSLITMTTVEGELKPIAESGRPLDTTGYNKLEGVFQKAVLPELPTTLLGVPIEKYKGKK